MNALRYAQMLNSRICHDLISPVSAISSGLELINECSKKDKEQLLSICQQSADKASRRLVYYRAAFGYSAVFNLVSFDTLEKLLKDYLDLLKISLNWSKDLETLEKINQYIELPFFIRILLNLVLIASEAGPYGGELEILFEIDDDTFFVDIELTGKLVEIRPEVKMALQDQIDEKDFTPHNIHAVMTGMLLEEQNIVTQKIHSNKELLSLKFCKNSCDQNIIPTLFS